VGEGHKERVDRELLELLNELRVALPGVQVLFAFLLTVPFTQRFGRLTSFQQDVYFATFLLTAASSVLLIAPTAHHRLRFRSHDKERMLFAANRLAIAGTVLLAFAMSGAVYLIADLLFGQGAAALVTGIAAGAFVMVWYVPPLLWALAASAHAEEGGEEDG